MIKGIYKSLPQMLPSEGKILERCSDLVLRINKVAPAAIFLFSLAVLPGVSGGPVSYGLCVSGCMSIGTPVLLPACVTACLALIGPWCP